MKVKKLEADVGIISGLSDYPNTDGGLTASELKAKFDEGNQIIKKYINDTLVPAIDENCLIVTIEGHAASCTAKEIYTHIEKGGAAVAYWNGIYYQLTRATAGCIEFSSFEVEQDTVRGILVYNDGSAEYYGQDIITSQILAESLAGLNAEIEGLKRYNDTTEMVTVHIDRNTGKADHTSKEINGFVDAGRLVMLESYGSRIPLSYSEAGLARFVLALETGEIFIYLIDADGNYTMEEPEFAFRTDLERVDVYLPQDRTEEEKAKARENIGVKDMLLVEINVEDAYANATAVQIHEHIKNGGAAVACCNGIYYQLTRATLGWAEFNSFETEQDCISGVLVWDDGSVECYSKDIVTSRQMDEHRSESKQTLANALKGTASGNPVCITDISPVEHEISVKLSGNSVTDFSKVTVSRCGDDLAANKKLEIPTTVSALSLTLESGELKEALKAGHTYTVFADISSDAEEKRFRLDTDPVAGPLYLELGMLVGEGRQSVTFTVGENDYPRIRFYAAKDNTTSKSVATTFDNITIVEEKDRIDYTPTADGTVDGVMSLAPTTTLIAGSGTTISAEYNRDTNKVIAKQEERISQLEATVTALLGG